MYTWRNPPADFLASEAKRNIPFALAVSEMLPHIVLHTLEVIPMGDSDYRVNLVVENTGFFPTYTSAQGKKRKAIRPVRVELELPEEVKLVNGKRRVELGHLEGRSNKLEVSTLWSNSPTDNRARSEWVFHTESSAKVLAHVLSERAGVLHVEVELSPGRLLNNT